MAIIKLGANAITSLPAGVGGKVLQVVSTNFTDTVTTSSATPIDVSGFSATLAPSSTSNKIYIMMTVTLGGTSTYPYYLCERQISGGANTTLALGSNATGVQVNTLASARMDATGVDFQICATNFLDTPNTTSPITYQMQFASPYATGYMNRQTLTSNNNYIQFPISSITVMEVSA